MKKIIVLLFMLVTGGYVMAQNALPKYNFRLGLTAHPTLGYIKAKNGKSNGVSPGFSYGLLGDFDFSDRLSFATALTITTINGKSVEINPNHYHDAANSNRLAYDIKYKIQYVEIPLTVKLKLSRMGNLRWFGQAGLTTDFAIGRKQNASLGNTELANNVDARAWTNLFRMGLVIGGGLEYKLAEKTTVVTGISLNNGLSNIVKAPNGMGDNVRNHYVGLNLGVFF